LAEPRERRKRRGERSNRLRAAEARASARRRWSVALLVVLAVAVAGGGYAWTMFQPRAARHWAIKVTVPAGREGEALERAGVIRSALAFKVYTSFHGEEGKLLPGRYKLSPTMTLAQVTRQLRLGPGHSIDDVVRISVPEGFTIRQIAARLEKEQIADGAAFLQAALNPDPNGPWPYDFPRPPGSLEGYLYPDTYEFLPNSPVEKVLDDMLLNFSRRFFRPYQHQIAAGGGSLHEIVTIASLIEREAKTQEDRPRIAGVIENRLKRGMKLEVDATVLYALGHHKQRVFFKDLLVDSPYNTYRHAGLPPGPIASPGALSLQAALAPEKNDYLFYVARPNGSHYFTHTSREHEAAKKQARAEWPSVSSVDEDAGGKSHEP
jgi:UPF0755 protein